MAIAEMEKLNLVAMSYDRDKILNVLQKTGATEIKCHYEAENTSPVSVESDGVKEYYNRLESILSALSSEAEKYNKENKVKTDDLKDGFIVSYTEFMSADGLKAEVDAVCDEIASLLDRRRALAAERVKLLRDKETAQIYRDMKEPFSDYSDTRNVKIRLGTVPANEADKAIKSLPEGELCSLSVLGADENSALVLFVSHKSFGDADGLLQSFSFARCPYTGDETGEDVFDYVCEKLVKNAIEKQEIDEQIYSYAKDIKKIKIYCDYIAFQLEKDAASEKMRRTERTVLLEAYVPREAEGLVKDALDGAGTVYYEFSEVPDGEMPPTLYKNNEVVKNFETITNMYSPANAREMDPNTVMAFFYSLFLGFIMGDIGYGLFMLLGGGFIYMKKRGDDGGLKRLSGVFAIGGIFAIIWGVLFNSFFGIGILPFTVMPDAQRDMWHFMGIQIPSVLIISLVIGVVQLMAGYICRAVQCMRRGQFWDGMLDGLVWAVFSMGVGLAIAGLVDEFDLQILAATGGIIAGVSLAIAVLTAGRKEKLLGKFTKGFGAAYGVINYASDILSYARLYGLMLSGAVIAQIVSGYAVTGMNGGVGFIVSGNPVLIILGVLILVVGHAFNLAIGLLGAYIHDARLQYVEFYGKFFEGEGELFAPLGSGHKYVKVVSNF